MAEGTTHHRIPDWLRTFWLTTTVLFVLSGITYVIQLLYWPKKYPYNNPLFQPFSNQFDFDCFVDRFRQFHHPRFFTDPAIPPFTYPAPVSFIYQGFFHVFGNAGPAYPAHYAYLGTCCLAYLLAAFLFGRALYRRGLSKAVSAGLAATMLVTSYPIALQLYLANVEAFVWMVVAVGIWAWYREHDYLAALCFGIATSLKIFPFVYFGLLLFRSKYRQVAFGLAICFALTLGALRVLGPFHESYRGIQDGLAYFQRVYVEHFNYQESGMDHSLFALPKVVIWSLQPHMQFGPLSRIFLALEAVTGLALLPRIQKLLPVNQLLMLTIASVLLPIVSHDYTLLHMYAPWALLVLCLLERRCMYSRRITVELLCFAVLFTCQDYVIWNGMRYAGQLKCLVLLVLAGYALSDVGRLRSDADAPHSLSWKSVATEGDADVSAVALSS